MSPAGGCREASEGQLSWPDWGRRKERDLGQCCALQTPRAVGGGVGSRSPRDVPGVSGAMVDTRGFPKWAAGIPWDAKAFRVYRAI